MRKRLTKDSAVVGKAQATAMGGLSATIVALVAVAAAGVLAPLTIARVADVAVPRHRLVLAAGPLPAHKPAAPAAVAAGAEPAAQRTPSALRQVSVASADPQAEAGKTPAAPAPAAPSPAPPPAVSPPAPPAPPTPPVLTPTDDTPRSHGNDGAKHAASRGQKGGHRTEGRRDSSERRRAKDDSVRPSSASRRTSTCSAPAASHGRPARRSEGRRRPHDARR